MWLDIKVGNFSPQTERDYRAIDSSLQEFHGCGVAYISLKT